MTVLEDTKQQIIDKLNDVPVNKLRSMLDFVTFIAMDPVSRSLLTCPVEEKPLHDDARELIEEAANESRPGFPTSKSVANSDCENAGVDASGEK